MRPQTTIAQWYHNDCNYFLFFVVVVLVFVVVVLVLVLVLVVLVVLVLGFLWIYSLASVGVLVAFIKQFGFVW